MPIFADLAAMQARFEARDLLQLTDHENTGTLVENRIINALDSADALITGYVASRHRNTAQFAGKTLTDSAQLKGSIHSEPANGSVRWGSNKVYARIHNEGFDGTVTVGAHSRSITQAFGRQLPGGLTVQVASFERHMNMPARTFLGINAEDEAELITLTEEYAADLAGGFV